MSIAIFGRAYRCALLAAAAFALTHQVVRKQPGRKSRSRSFCHSALAASLM